MGEKRDRLVKVISEKRHRPLRVKWGGEMDRPVRVIWGKKRDRPVRVKWGEKGSTGKS